LSITDASEGGQPDRTRALSFGSIAVDYHRYRPRTPSGLLDWLLPASARDVVDLAAGTGALTELLVQRPVSVTAVEPDPGMRQVLVEAAPGAIVVAGTAEAIPLPDACADVLFAASAWHWFDPERAVPEIARVLRDGGSLCVLRNGMDTRVEWVAGLRTRTVTPSERQRLGRDHLTLPAGSPFTDAERHEVTWVAPMPVMDLLNLLETFSQAITATPQERRRSRERAILLLSEHPDTRGLDVIDVPMRSIGWRAVRESRVS
jgi:SAM-dependent methyltransferase